MKVAGLIEEYCPLCVDYFENIQKHNYDRHDKKMIGYDQGIVNYQLPFLDRFHHAIMWSVEND